MLKMSTKDCSNNSVSTAK